MSSRKGKCPGCKTPKSSHQFGTPGKNCTGPSDGTEIQESPTSDEPSTSVLLEAIRNLSSQMETLQTQHNDLKKQVQSPPPQPPPVLVEQASKTNQQPSQQTTIAPVSPAPAANTATVLTTSVSEKLLQAAAKGEYIDFSDLLSTLSPFANLPNNGSIFPPQSDINCVTYVIKGPRKRQIDSFDTWLQAWNAYEKVVMAAQPSRYTELASYREQIQFANRKFRWSSVYMFDIHSRMAYAKRIQLGNSASLDVIDTTLYATVLDASALRPHPRQCSRCKSFDHLVKDCTFLAQDQMEENSPQKSTGYGARTSVGNQNLSWKYTRWYSPTGQEGCNLYQRKACSQGTNCKRAHICKSCRGDHPQADCTLTPSGTISVSN